MVDQYDILNILNRHDAASEQHISYMTYASSLVQIQKTNRAMKPHA